ncbi:MAG TPA: glycerol-3-phosphate 1-O-acyltransferase PlsY [Verrucomicrobiota bacterium]|nr:glycerol-3-phosphate 1-O-acyltransferase PlsY [Verrucomicrobiota bacterium]
MTIILCLAAVVFGYLLGSVPTGFLVGRARGVDLRSVGSGNIGATNALRVLGKKAGAMVLILDAAKGALACWGLPRLAAVVGPTAGSDQNLLSVLAGAGAILGHNYTCWLKFKGGKGVATSAGVLAVITPVALLLATAVWVIVFVVGRYVSLASISAALALPFLVWLTKGNSFLTAFAVLMAAVVIYAHRSNIKRLVNGTEHRFGRNKALDAAEEPLRGTDTTETTEFQRRQTGGVARTLEH